MRTPFRLGRLRALDVRRHGRPMTRRSRTLRRCVASMLLCAAWPGGAHALTYFGLVNTGELYASSSAGVTWTARAALPVRDARALLAGATASELYLASASGSFYRSADAGVTWTAVGAVPASDVAALAPYTGRLVLVTRSGSVYASTDAGATFTAVGAIAAPDLVGIARLTTTLVAVSRTGSAYRSTDGGATWIAAGTLPVSDAVSVAAFANKFHVLTATGDIATSADAGATWTFVSTLSQSGMTALVASASELMACMNTGEVATSSDGLSWTWRGALGQMSVLALATDQPNATAVGAPEPAAADAFSVRAGRPGDAMTLAFALDRAADVSVDAYDLAGRRVAQPLTRERLQAGATTRAWRPDALARGVYFIAAHVGDALVTRHAVWLK